jgi:hypothetical protein
LGVPATGSRPRSASPRPVAGPTTKEATILSELKDNTGIGQRQYQAEDLEGHRWMFATRL